MKEIKYVLMYGRESTSVYGMWRSWVNVTDVKSLAELHQHVEKLVKQRAHVIRIDLAVDNVLTGSVKLRRELYEAMDNVNEVMVYAGMSLTAEVCQNGFWS